MSMDGSGGAPTAGCIVENMPDLVGCAPIPGYRWQFWDPKCNPDVSQETLTRSQRNHGATFGSSTSPGRARGWPSEPLGLPESPIDPPIHADEAELRG